MSVGTAFHPRTAPLNRKLQWREWSGYLAASAYHDSHEIEYNAIREAAALIDVSPLYKYLVSGPDSTRLVDRVITRDAGKLAVGRVYYTSWCNEDGRVVDDGTVARLDERTYRWTAADPSLRWLRMNASGLDVEIEDVSERNLGRGDPGAAEPRRPRSGDRGRRGATSRTSAAVPHASGASPSTSPGRATRATSDTRCGWRALTPWSFGTLSSEPGGPTGYGLPACWRSTSRGSKRD